MNVRFIISGGPCSGTTYVAEALRAHGIKAGHEVFEVLPGGEWRTPHKGSYEGIALEELEVDVSCGHAHVLGNLGASSPVKVIHLVRDPLKALNSWLADTLRHKELTSVDVVARRLWECNTAVNGSPRLIHRHRVEDSIEELIRAMGYPPLDTCPEKEVCKENKSHNQGRCAFSWDDFENHPWCEELRKQYQGYGY